MSRRPVVVDLLFFTGLKGGMESYVREVYGRLDRDDPELEFIGFASSELAAARAPWFPGALVDSGISGEDRIAWARGELFAVDRFARRVGAAVLHCPANFGPASPHVPVVLTVHDLLAFRYPEYVPGRYAAVIRAMVRRAARTADRVITVSDASRGDLHDLLGVASDRVTVVPLAGSDASATATAEADRRRDDQLLAVGNRMPHKNFERLLEALAAIPASRRPRLVVTGSHGPDPLAATVAALGLGEWVALRGWLGADELDRLYRESTALVFPTLFEGFGLPTLEAMSRGCPVICSDLPVLRDVAGPAARYFDPRDPASIDAAIEAVLSDAGLRTRMAAAGSARASEFSWERTARETRDVLRSVATPAHRSRGR